MIQWSQPSCSLHVCPHAKVEPAVLCSTKLKSFLQCSCSLSSTSFHAMTYRSLKVFTTDVFPSMHVRVGCSFLQCPFCSLVSVLAASAALVSVSHWLAVIHVPHYLYHIILQHFLTWAGSGSFAENLDYTQPLTHCSPGAIQMLLCWALKGGTSSLASRQSTALTQKVYGFSSPKHLNTSPALKNRRK